MNAANKARERAKYELAQARKAEKQLTSIYEKKFFIIMNKYSLLMKPYWKNDEFDLISYNRDKTYNRKFREKINEIEKEIVATSEELAVAATTITTSLLVINYQRTVNVVMKEFNRVPSLTLTLEDNILQRVRKPFTADAKVYSERIWGNTDYMKTQLQGVLSKGIQEGKSIPNMTKEFQSIMGNSYNNCRRIIRTETIATHTKAHLDSYAEIGVKKIKILESQATDESCSPFNGTIILLEDANVGYNCPPFHPNCAGTVAPHITN